MACVMVAMQVVPDVMVSRIQGPFSIDVVFVVEMVSVAAVRHRSMPVMSSETNHV